MSKADAGIRRHSETFLALRAGRTTFDEVARLLAPLLARRARYFLKQWSWCGQVTLTESDLVQDMLIALWRAVDTWDTKRSDIAVYVDVHLGRTCRDRLRRVAGYPDPRRSRPIVRVSAGESFDFDSIGDAMAPQPEEVVMRRRDAEALVSKLAGFDRHVVTLVLEGKNSRMVATQIYRDPETRLEYQMDSEAHARRMVGEAIRRARHVAISARAA